VNTLIKPRIPKGSEPSREDDPTGVRALLSSLPQPEPMPAHLIERINASLAAEQAQRAAKASSASVTPLLARARRRPARLWFGLAGAAAAVALVAVVGNNMFSVRQTTAINGSAAVASSSDAGASAGGAQPPAAEKGATPGALAGRLTSPTLVQIGQSGTRYTQAGFVTQAQALRGAPLQPMSAKAADIGPAGTNVGLTQCLSAIGAAGAQAVRADVALYEGRPAVIIVATTNGIPMAYAVSRQCSQANATVLHPATPLP
jgi:hypothetical protein